MTVRATVRYLPKHRQTYRKPPAVVEQVAVFLVVRPIVRLVARFVPSAVFADILVYRVSAGVSEPVWPIVCAGMAKECRSPPFYLAAPLPLREAL